MTRFSTALVLGWLIWPQLAISQQTPPFTPVRVLGPQPPIVAAPAVPASRGDVADEELVLGVEVNGAARAYPINMLNGPRREIINDTLGGKAIAATW